GHVLAADEDPATVDSQNPDERLQEGALARAVRADDGDNLTGANRDRNVTNDGNAAVARCDPFGTKRGCRASIRGGTVNQQGMPPRSPVVCAASPSRPGRSPCPGPSRSRGRRDGRPCGGRVRPSGW